MEQRIQYVRSSDGVDVAYYAIGDGPTLVSISLPSSHVQREWQLPPWRAMFETVAQVWRFVRLDPRGLGLSTRDVHDFSLDALVRDVEAVVDRLGAPTIQLMGYAIGGTVALAYAARHPERVSHVVLLDGFDRGIETMHPRLAALSELLRTDWEFASEGILRAFVGWDDDEAARTGAELLRESIRPEQLVALTEQLHEWDVTAELPRITAKTLVIQHERNPAVGPQVARRLAATIPDCEVAMLGGPMHAVLEPATAALVAQFLMDAPRSPMTPMPAPPPRHRTEVIFFADIVGSTALTERIGDLDFRERTRALDRRLREVIIGHGGDPIDGKLLGDGVLALFAAATDAIAAAIECAAAGDATGLRLHLGLHAGDVIREAGNVHGGAVNVAARISAKAEPGEVLVSDVVRTLARTSTSVAFEDRGVRRLKGVADPLRVYRAHTTG